jgi:CTP:molybdopterin cytidylyltransferase MocA
VKVAGIILAAGRSVRMGRAKALLEMGESTFLEHAIGILAGGGCSDVIAVLGRGEVAGRAGELARAGGAKPVENPGGGEQIESLRVGLASAPADAAAAIVLPVDHPLADAGTVATLIGEFEATRAPIVRPVYRDRPGHPILLARILWPELADPALEYGARDVIHRHAEDIRDVPVDDRGVTVDIDTPAEYRREIGS